MSNLLITQLVAAVAVVGSISFFLAWIAMPAVKAREGAWNRIAAGFLSLYAFAVFAGAGVGLGIGIIWVWPQLTG